MLDSGLVDMGYRVVGPQVRDAAIVYADLDKARKLPIGLIDVQDGGTYRLREEPTAGYFDFVVGPHSLKNFLFPPREALVRTDPTGRIVGVATVDRRWLPIGGRRSAAHATYMRWKSRTACFYTGPMSIRAIAPDGDNSFSLPSTVDVRLPLVSATRCKPARQFARMLISH